MRELTLNETSLIAGGNAFEAVVVLGAIVLVAALASTPTYYYTTPTPYYAPVTQTSIPMVDAYGYPIVNQYGQPLELVATTTYY